MEVAGVEGAQILAVIREISHARVAHVAALIGVTAAIGLPMVLLTLPDAIEMDVFFADESGILLHFLQRFANTLNPLSRAPIMLDARDMVAAITDAIEPVAAREPYRD